jgi:hypothetical protein
MKLARFTFNGVKEMRANLRKAAQRAPKVVGRAMRYETEIEATESKRRTPVDTSALRNTIRAIGPEFEGNRISTAIVAGDVSVTYAWIVHEDLEANHKVGQAKYIESTINESAPYMARRVSNRINVKDLL